MTRAIPENDEGFLWRQTARSLRQLMKKTLDDVPTGMMGLMAGPLRSPVWSNSRIDSVGDKWTQWYRLNETNGNVQNVTGEPELAGIRRPVGTDANLPVLSQPGGLSSEGDSSVYFPNLTSPPASLIEAPMAITTQRAWTLEVIFKTDGLPQSSAMMIFNGTLGTNGFGMMVGAASTSPGSKLIYRATTLEYIDTGITLIDKQWYHAIFVSDDTDSTLKWYVGTITSPGKVFSYVSGSHAAVTPVIPTGSSIIGGQSAVTSPYNLFKGWISEALFYEGKLAGTTAKLGAEDRIRCGLEPAPPNGWLKCDGSAVSRTEYAQLFARLGTVAGVGDGSKTFNLPNVVAGIIKA